MSNKNFEKSTFLPFCSTFFPFLAIKLKCRIEILHKSTFFPFVRHFFLLVRHFFLFFVIKEKMSNDIKWLQRVALQQKHSTFFPFKFWVRHFFLLKFRVRHFFLFLILHQKYRIVIFFLIRHFFLDHKKRKKCRFDIFAVRHFFLLPSCLVLHESKRIYLWLSKYSVSAPGKGNM